MIEDTKSNLSIIGVDDIMDDIEKQSSTNVSSTDDDDEDDDEKKTLYQIQTSWAVLRQMLLPFLIAGIGSVFAGVVLNAVTQWPVFVDIPQISIMVTAFLGLIGNIETTLASRLSTQANLGRMDKWHGIRDIVFGNFMVIQCQASTVGLFAAICSLAISTIREETRQKLSIDSIILLCSTSVITSIIANTLIASIIIIVILVARRLGINPDNISTPVAASMGDVCTISILAFVSQFLYDIQYGRQIQITLMAVCLCVAPVFGVFARRNRWTRSVIYSGWTAILGAVIIEQPGGVVMEKAFQNYKVMSTFQPLVNGIGSNLVGIQTSRMSTFLHASAPKGLLPTSNPTPFVSPWFVFFSKDLHARMARLLMVVLVPAHLFYIAIIFTLQNTFDFNVAITGPFMSVYIIAVVLQLALLLYLAYISVFWAWKHRINPDNSAIPFTSALADVFGNCLMAIAFTFLKWINDDNTKIMDFNDDMNVTTIMTNYNNNNNNFTMATIEQQLLNNSTIIYY
ncbi:solute carrier family 41-like protein [Euroglyphus maynei]|uniref:Solute carrier family 41-like protein n=1 Tax=Euroglyphus maynei TaxID=6958 RepID=A0A1Y3BB85_EURMA|nr:solute carrier family 41-like protein [Euroglyphus maynei]